jgi:hypothetical protein
MIEVVPLRLGSIDVDVADLRFGHTGVDTLALPMWASLVRSGDEAILVNAGPPSLEWCAGKPCRCVMNRTPAARGGRTTRHCPVRGAHGGPDPPAPGTTAAVWAARTAATAASTAIF